MVRKLSTLNPNVIAVEAAVDAQEYVGKSYQIFTMAGNCEMLPAIIVLYGYERSI